MNEGFMKGSFIEELKILDSWESENEKFRIVNLGMGPDRLEVFKKGEWHKELACYEWDVVISRLLHLKNDNS